MICLDEMGPESAKSFAGQRLVQTPGPDEPAERARQEIDYGRRGRGYIFGAFRPATAHSTVGRGRDPSRSVSKKDRRGMSQMGQARPLRRRWTP